MLYKIKCKKYIYFADWAIIKSLYIQPNAVRICTYENISKGYLSLILKCTSSKNRILVIKALILSITYACIVYVISLSDINHQWIF